MAQKLQALQYVRPDFDAFRLEFIMAVQRFKKCESVGQMHAAVQNIDNLTKNIISTHETLKTLAAQNPNNETYQNELLIWQQHQALLRETNNRFFSGLIKSKFRSQLEGVVPSVKLTLATNHVRAYLSDNEDLIQAEQQLIINYQNILNTATISIDGRKKHLTDVIKHYQCYDATTKKNIFNTAHAFLQAHNQELLVIYQQIAANRSEQATNANFDNFGEYNLQISNHFDYPLTEITTLCQHILTFVPDNHSALIGNLNLDIPKFASAESLIDHLSSVFTAISPETNKFFQYLLEHNVLTVIDDEHTNVDTLATFTLYNETPHITINLASLPLKLDKMLNQFGRAFQAYAVRGLRSSDLLFSLPTSQASIAKSLEFIAWPWLYHLTADSSQSYQQAHLNKNIFVLRSTAADIIFLANCYQVKNFNFTNLTTRWHQIHQLEWPDINDMLWLFDQQLLVNPFGGIDTILSILVALQFWQPETDNEESKVLDNYFAFAKNSSKFAFADLITQTDGIESPIELATLQQLINKINAYHKALRDVATFSV